MATITFPPDRINAEPVVFKGFTMPELFITAELSVLATPSVYCPGIASGTRIITRVKKHCFACGSGIYSIEEAR